MNALLIFRSFHGILFKKTPEFDYILNMNFHIVKFANDDMYDLVTLHCQ